MKIMVLSPTVIPYFSNFSKKDIELFLSDTKRKTNHLSLSFYNSEDSGSYYTNLSDPGLDAKSVAIASHISDKCISKKIDKLSFTLEKITTTFYSYGVLVIRGIAEVTSVDCNQTREDFDNQFGEIVRSIFKDHIELVLSRLGCNSYGNFYFQWLHKIFLLQSDGSDVSDHWLNKISASTLRGFKENGDRAYFGWGNSVVNQKKYESLVHISCGCDIAQFFYFSFHTFNKSIPGIIAQLNTDYSQGKLGAVRKTIVSLKHKIFEIEMQYADYLHSVAGDMRETATQFDMNWRIAELRTNVLKKIPILQDLLQDAENRASRKSNTFIEAILFGVSIFSLVGLFLSAHDYLSKPANQHRNSLDVILGMLPTNPHDILSLAVGISILSIVIFVLLKLPNSKE